MTRAEIVVVGAGPAGMRAALAAADAGAHVTVVDTAPVVGGQFHRQSGGPENVPDGAELMAHPNIRHLGESTVWAVEATGHGHDVHVLTGPADGPGRRRETLTAAALVLATGAYDRALPFPGWDLPGVVTAGAAQALAKGQHLAVGARVVVAGTGPFLLPVAQSLVDVGAEVVEVLEANRAVGGWLRSPGAMIAGTAKMGELAGYVRTLLKHRVPYRARRTVVQAHGTDRVTSVTTAALDSAWRRKPGTEREIEVDAVCVGFGFTPQLELAISARCRIVGGFVEVDGNQATSTDGVFAAGELTGIGGADLAAAEGTIAGYAAAAHIGLDDKTSRKHRRKARTGRIFAAGLDRAYPVRPGWHGWLTDDTIVCRCEEVTVGRLKAAAEQADGARALKLASRVGLGPCQGRVCGRAALELVGRDPAGIGARPIATPLRLGELAGQKENT